MKVTSRAYFFAAWLAAGAIVAMVGIWGDPLAFLRDALIYQRAVEAVHAGQDPYVAGLQLQQRARQSGIEELTWAFVYPPATLPVLHIAARMPVWLYRTLFWFAYIACAIAQLWALVSMLAPAERRVAQFIAPACFIFPGAMYSRQSIFSGNVVYILYGLIFSGAAIGWRKNRWAWFYAAVLVTSLVKPQMLTLLVIPPLCSWGEWWRATLTAIGSFTAIGAQILIWPEENRRWQHALQVQLTYYDREFANGPVGILGRTLWRHGLPYELPCAICYLVLAALILAALIDLSRRYRAGRLTLTDWLPELIVGAILLNPRILENDVYACTIALAAIVWRVCRALAKSAWLAAWGSLSVMLVLNLLVFYVLSEVNMAYWNVQAGFVTVCFIAGYCQLRRKTQPIPH